MDNQPHMPPQEIIDELFALTHMVRTMMEQLASSDGVALSVYYTLFVGELVHAAQTEGNFEPIMNLLRRDALRWEAMLQAKDAQQFYEIAKATADYVDGECQQQRAH